jgi:hypothetical protein
MVLSNFDSQIQSILGLWSHACDTVSLQIKNKN